MKKQQSGFSVVFIVKTNDSVETIIDIMHCKPTHMTLKGTSKSIYIEEAAQNIFVYEKKYFDTDYDNCILDFLSLYQITPQRLIALCKVSSCRLRFCIQSDYAQIFFPLSKATLKYLYEMDIPIEFSVLSWGGVDC